MTLSEDAVIDRLRRYRADVVALPDERRERILRRLVADADPDDLRRLRLSLEGGDVEVLPAAGVAPPIRGALRRALHRIGLAPASSRP